ncbi:MAG: 30S ribosomal protein S6 [Chlamydiae bacterium]|nr:30S ribosomal protein S6 [Chlamydiota bacterium]
MKKQKKQLYEGMFIISTHLSEDARNHALKRVTSKIETFDGKTEKVIEMGRKKLAYEIRMHKEGYYYLIYFNADTNILAELQREFHLNEDLLRFVLEKTDRVLESLEFKKLVETEG